MSTIGYSTLEVIPTVKNLRSQLEAQTSKDLATAGKRGGQKFGDAAGTAAGRSFKSKFSGLAKDVAAPVAGIFAGAAVVGLFKNAISGASDLAESGNKIQVIFGDATKQVNDFAKQGARALGQTQLEVLNAAGTFGTFGKAAGLSGSSLADFSTKLAGLSTDLASFFNTDPAQAVEALGAGLRGESEPLRQFGVLLDDATLRQEALRLGLVKTTKQALSPQQRVLAAYQVILRQTKDAQGDFSRTSGGLANQQRILAAQWSEMQTTLGKKLLPAATATAKAFNDDVLPAIGAAGGVAKDAVSAFAGLPAPVKAAAGAFVALRLAALAGVGATVAAGASAAGSAMTGLRIRALLAADSFKTLRAGQLTLTAGSGQFTAGTGRMAASLGALRAASVGAGAGLKRGLAGASAFVGGPWGAAFLAGTAILTKFYLNHQKAKQRVEEFTATLDKQTGALTESSREFAAQELLDSGALKTAKALGISLTTVTDAALGNKTALSSLNTQLAALLPNADNLRGAGRGAAAAIGEQGAQAGNLSGAIGSLNDVVDKSRAKNGLLAEALGKGVTTTNKTVAATRDYASELDKTRASVLHLLDAENKRRQGNLSAFQDQTALAQAIFDARREAYDGAKTLDLNTEAGRKNRDALGALAAQWNNSADSVKNAKGAYANFREQFIKIADVMGVSRDKAKELADRLLGIPKNTPAAIHTPGMEAALAAAKKLREDLEAARRAAGNIALNQGARNRGELSSIRKAGGGLLRGPGSGTSDSILMWGSNGEFMQRKRAVDYYGVDFMRRLNNLQVPKFAGGGLVGGSTSVTHGPGVNIESQTVLVQDPNDFLRKMNQRASLAGLGGRRPS